MQPQSPFEHIELNQHLSLRTFWRTLRLIYNWPGPILLAGLLYSTPLVTARFLYEALIQANELGSQSIDNLALIIFLVAITLSGPGIVGIARCFVQAQRKERVTCADAMFGVKRAFSSSILAFTFLLSLLASVIALCIGTFLFGGIYMGAPAAMARLEGTRTDQAMMESRLVFQKNPWQSSFFFLPCFAILSSGYFLFGFAHIVAAPIAFGATSLAYIGSVEVSEPEINSDIQEHIR